MDKEKFVCNYCFVAECLDKHPEDIKKTKCTGLTEKESRNGGCCKYFSNKINDDAKRGLHDE